MPSRVRFDGLVFSRYIASCWIVAHHFYGQTTFEYPAAATAGVTLKHAGAKDAFRVFNWGTFWTQYFFFLSGFVLAVARLTSAKPDDLKPTWRFVLERLTTTYPAYLLALMLMLFNEGPRFATIQVADWINFGLHLTLLQAWWPQMVCASTTEVKIPLSFFKDDVTTARIHWNTPAWFMSALAFYWLLFKPLYRCLRRLPSASLIWSFLGCWLLAWLPAIDGLLFRSGPIDIPRDALYRYHPLMYLHVFFGGMIFARLFLEEQASDVGLFFGLIPTGGGSSLQITSSSSSKKQENTEKVKVVKQIESVVDEEDESSTFSVRLLHHQLAFLRKRFVARGATVGYIFIIIICSQLSVENVSNMKHHRENALFFFWHNGGLMPLFALLVAGLCSDRDPVTAVFKHPILTSIGSISYAQYILQGVVFHLVFQSYRAAYKDHALYRRPPYGSWAFQLVLPCVLFVSAFIVHYFLSVPCAEHLRRKLDALFSDAEAVPKKERSYGATGTTSPGGGFPQHGPPPKTGMVTV